jgi:hypothetical protein
MTKTYKSKIGLSFTIPLALSLLPGIIIMVINRIWVGVVIIGLITLFIVLFVAYLYANTYYKITDNNKLTIKGGFLVSIVIDINSIQSIEPTKTMWAAPALSLDRLQISYNKGSRAVISPKEKDDFIRQLKVISPNIIVK